MPERRGRPRQDLREAWGRMVTVTKDWDFTAWDGAQS